MQTKEHAPVEIPQEFTYAIATAVEMDYDGISTSPAYPQGAATGLGYPEEAFTAGLLAQFIRGLGYEAITQGGTSHDRQSKREPNQFQWKNETGGAHEIIS